MMKFLSKRTEPPASRPIRDRDPRYVEWEIPIMRSIRRILVVRVGRAGDMVMITPALKAIFAVQPEAEIHLLTGPEGKRIISGFDPRLTTFHISRGGPVRRFLERAALLKSIRAHGYDLVLVFESDLRFRRLFRALASPVYYLENRSPNQHYSECCVELAEKALEVSVPRFNVYLPVTEEGKKKAAIYYQAGGIEGEATVIGFHATCSSAGAPAFRKRDTRIHRSWPAVSFISLAHLLHRYAKVNGRHWNIVMDVLPEERILVEEIAKESGGIVQILSGPPDFDRYKGVLKRMSLLVTPDTGPMHIAAAVGTPLVALFSRKSPTDCGPYCSESMARVLRAEDTAHRELGLAAISPEEVFESCLRFMKV